MDHGNAALKRAPRRPAGDRLTEDLQPPGIEAVIAADDLADGRLAGAVLADDGVHLAGAEIEIDGVEHPRRAEALLDLVEADDDLRHEWRLSRHGVRGTPPPVSQHQVV